MRKEIAGALRYHAHVRPAPTLLARLAGCLPEISL
jgi:hypothetical protein